MTDPVPSPYGSLLYDDYSDMIAGTATQGRTWGNVMVGAGAGVASSAGGTNRFGVVTMSTGTTNTGSVRYSTGGLAFDNRSLLWAYANVVMGVGVLSSPTDAYQCVVGFVDTFGVNQSAFQANFLYDSEGVAAGGVASPYLQAWVRDGASVVVVPLDGSVHAGIATLPVLVQTVVWPSTNVLNTEISVAPSGVVFAVNGVRVAVLPAPVGNSVFGHMFGVFKSAGVTTRSLQVDYVRLAAQRAGLPTP